MKTVTYTACSRVGFGDVIVCVSTELTVDGAPFIEGVLSAIGVNCAECDPMKRHCYQILYDENQLLDPATPLVSCDIEGVYVRDCLTKYIDWLFGQAIVPPVP
jgi:hypothetical protein